MKQIAITSIFISYREYSTKFGQLVLFSVSENIGWSRSNDRAQQMSNTRMRPCTYQVTTDVVDTQESRYLLPNWWPVPCMQECCPRTTFRYLFHSDTSNCVSSVITDVFLNAHWGTFYKKKLAQSQWQPQLYHC